MKPTKSKPATLQAIPAKAGGQLYIVIAEAPKLLSGVRSTPGTRGRAAAGGRAAELVNQLQRLGETVGDTCAEMVGAAIKRLKDVQPAELEIEFGVTLGGEAGVPFVTKGEAEASFKITAKWVLTPAKG